MAAEVEIASARREERVVMLAIVTKQFGVNESLHPGGVVEFAHQLAIQIFHEFSEEIPADEQASSTTSIVPSERTRTTDGVAGRHRGSTKCDEKRPPFAAPQLRFLLAGFR